MVKRGYNPEQVINKLREAEIYINQGSSISEASRKIGITEQTYYRLIPYRSLVEIFMTANNC